LSARRDQSPGDWEYQEAMGPLSVAGAGSLSLSEPDLLGPAKSTLPGATAVQPAERDRMLRTWVDRYLDFVARVLRNAGTPAAEVDDAAQRTFIVAARRFADVIPGSERGFLLRIALNEAAHARRSAARRREVPASELPERIDLSTPEVLTSLKRQRKALERILDRLEPELRTIFVLFEIEELTMAQIAGVLEIPPGTVASRLRRAREQFRERLDELRRSSAGGES
jgi:RNA polymerase sigma-70 factor, ECF subfamily